MIEFKDEKQTVFAIPFAALLLDITAKETGKPDKVTFLNRLGHIVKVEWEHLF